MFFWTNRGHDKQLGRSSFCQGSLFRSPKSHWIRQEKVKLFLCGQQSNRTTTAPEINPQKANLKPETYKMHFNKSVSSESLLANTNSNSSSSAAADAASSALRLSSPSSSSSSSSVPSSSSSSASSSSLRLGLWCFLLVAVILMAQQQPCEGRYLPTRSRGDELDKLRELMLQVSFFSAFGNLITLSAPHGITIRWGCGGAFIRNTYNWC